MMRPISVIIPSFNGERRLPGLLQSIRDQRVDQSLLELIVVDDDSTDGTRDVAARFGARVVRNGEHQADRGKAIGIRAASHDLLLLIDDDNRFAHPNALGALAAAYDECPDAVGAQVAWTSYDRCDPAANRYCSLFGIGDPMAFYLGRRDHLMRSERSWTRPGTVLRETPEYWLVRLTPRLFPTIGSNGFLVSRQLVEKTRWWPYYFHVDSNYQLALQGQADYVILKDAIIHDYCRSTAHLLGKLRRNLELYLKLLPERTYRWETSIPRLAAKTLWMVLVLGPLARACIEFVKTRDAAVFLHPYLCFVVPTMYVGVMLAHRLSPRAHPAGALKGG
jgi:glycosyltransferase involved in cell wall biosynthesis